MLFEKKIWRISLIPLLLFCIMNIPNLHLPRVSTVAGQVYGGTMVIATAADPKNLNPLLEMTYWGCLVFSHVYNNLFNIDPNGEITPELAESWSWSADMLTLTIHLQHNVLWHDGEPFTSEDVKYSVEALQEYHPYKLIFSVITQVDTPDLFTVVFKLAHPFLVLQCYFAGTQYGSMLPKHIYNGTDFFTNPHNWEPIGTGPFKFKEWTKDVRIVLVKNENYFRQGLPYLDQVIIRPVPDESGRVMMLEKGEVDYIPFSFPRSDVQRMQNVSGIKVYTMPYWVQEQLHFSFIRPITGNLLVRQAIAHAVDRQAILETARSNVGKISDTYIPDNVPSEAELLIDPNAHLIEVYPYNLTKANELLDKAGYPRGGDGIRFQLELSTTVSYYGTECLDLVRDQLAKIGIKCITNPMDNAVFWSHTTVGDFDIAYFGFGTYPAVNLFNLKYTTAACGQQFSNAARYNNTRIDELATLMIQASDPQEVKEMAYEIQNILVEVLPNIPLYRSDKCSAYRDIFANVTESHGHASRGTLDAAWLTVLPIDQSIPTTWIAVISAVIIVGVGATGVYWIRRRRK